MRRLFVRTAFGLCMSILASIHAYGASICWGPVYDPASNTDLYVVSKGTWAQTETEATQLGGNLTTIHSATENSFIVSNVLQDFTGVGGPNLYDAPLWIGLYDPTGIAGGADGGSGASSQHAANFVWVDGSTAVYRNWAGLDPNNNGGVEFYGTINWSAAGGYGTFGDWTDNPLAGVQGWSPAADGPYYGLVAVPTPEPSAIVLFGIAAASLLAYGWRRLRTA